MLLKSQADNFCSASILITLVKKKRFNQNSISKINNMTLTHDENYSCDKVKLVLAIIAGLSDERCAGHNYCASSSAVTARPLSVLWWFDPTGTAPQFRTPVPRQLAPSAGVCGILAPPHVANYCPSSTNLPSLCENHCSLFNVKKMF